MVNTSESTPQDREKATLDYVNSIRKKIGKRSIKKLRKGYLRDGRSCPVANSINTDGYQDVYVTEFEVLIGDSIYRNNNKNVEDFIIGFDLGLFPHLEKKEYTRNNG